jgi:acetate kinase
MSLLILNGGSSSIKFSLFQRENLTLIFQGECESIFDQPVLWIKKKEKEIHRQTEISPGYRSCLVALLKYLDQFSENKHIQGIGHRVVHGGKSFQAPTLINDQVLETLKTFIPLAPLHQSYNLDVIQEMAFHLPHVPQVACFDTSFHRTQPKIAELFGLPLRFYEEGILRYGFHGLSYDSIAQKIPTYMEGKPYERVIVAHLGNGASLCALKNLRSIATTMGFTALEGLMMGTRCGSIDPGVILYLLEERKYTPHQITHLLYHNSGLKGISGISSDMRTLLTSESPSAKLAIDLFCYRVAHDLSSLIPSLGGLDSIVFTAGIGENCPQIRQNICNHLQWLGIHLHDFSNNQNLPSITTEKSSISVYVIPTNEEYVIANGTKSVLYPD